MPMDTSLFRSVEAGTYMGDCDIGEIFLNFVLDPAIRPHAGAEFKDIFKEKIETVGKASQEVIWE